MFELAKRDPDEKPSLRRGRRAAVVKLIDRMPGGVLPPPPQSLSARHHPKARRKMASWRKRAPAEPAADSPPADQVRSNPPPA
jgi:hypothetical protein